MQRNVHPTRLRRPWGLLAVLLPMIVAAIVGTAAGTAGFTFVYAEGDSYLSNDPAACANCHVMQGHLDAWSKSSHHAVAVCNDCHAPHDSLVGKYTCKARNGWNHSWAFTTGWFHEPIAMTDYNRDITEATCRSCHDDIVHAIDLTRTSLASGGVAPQDEAAMSCIRCHADVGHNL